MRSARAPVVVRAVADGESRRAVSFLSPCTLYLCEIMCVYVYLCVLQCPLILAITKSCERLCHCAEVLFFRCPSVVQKIVCSLLVCSSFAHGVCPAVARMMFACMVFVLSTTCRLLVWPPEAPSCGTK